MKKNNCSAVDEVFEIISEFEGEISDFSKKFPEKTFVYVDVDCFGGTCLYEGFIVKNGKISYCQERAYDGHIKLLEKLNSSFRDWNFEPFTRDFFTKKGMINGLINNFTIAGLWLALKNDYPDTKKYYVDGGANELILRCHKNYYYYFTSSNKNIKVTGVLYNDDDEIVREVSGIPDNSFIGMEYELEIYLSEKNKIINKTSADNGYESIANTVKSEPKVNKSNLWSRLKKWFS